MNMKYEKWGIIDKKGDLLIVLDTRKAVRNYKSIKKIDGTVKKLNIKTI